MEEKVLYNVLRNVGSGNEHHAAPDSDYLKACESIGLIKPGWDRELTDLGRFVRDSLESKIYG